MKKTIQIPEMTNRQINLLFSKINTDSGLDGCWNWTGCTDKDGYGHVRINKRSYRVHRVIATFRFGQLPDGLVIDHTCRNTSCCNPIHLEVVTNRENVCRGSAGNLNSSRTRGTVDECCPHGHDRSKFGYLDRRGWICCRACDHLREVARWRSFKQASLLEVRDGE